MKRLIPVLLAAFFLLGFYGVSGAAIIDFENVPGADANSADNPIPDDYYDFDWDQFKVIHEDYASGSGYDKGVVSGEWAAYNAYANVATVNDNSFDFTGAWFTAAYSGNLFIDIQGYSDGARKYYTTINVDNTGSEWFDVGFTGIDQLEFNSYSSYTGVGNQFVMDDFTYESTDTAPVPEPSTIMLMGIGLLGLVAYSRNRSQRII